MNVCNEALFIKSFRENVPKQGALKFRNTYRKTAVLEPPSCGPLDLKVY